MRNDNVYYDGNRKYLASGTSDREGLVVEGRSHLLNDVFRYGVGRCTSCCRKRLLESNDSMITE